MEQRKWFYLLQDQVQGPLTPHEIESKLNPEQKSLGRFWARGNAFWLSHSQYQESLKKDKELEQKKSNQSLRMWKVKDQDKELNPMSYEQLLIFLKEKKNFTQVKIWTEGFQDWQEVYSVEKILDELGINRRQHPRVPIDGSIHLETQTGAVWEGQISSISQGGFGVTKATAITIGERVKANIQSPSFRTNIHCSAEVVFINNQGVAGFKFVNISTEARSSIIAYVKKYVDDHPNESFLKMR